jgi:hypothetical protein
MANCLRCCLEAGTRTMWPWVHALRRLREVTHLCSPKVTQPVCKVSGWSDVPSTWRQVPGGCQNSAGSFHHSENIGATTRPMASVLM